MKNTFIEIHLFKLVYESGYTRRGLTLNEATTIKRGRKKVKFLCDRIERVYSSDFEIK